MNNQERYSAKPEQWQRYSYMDFVITYYLEDYPSVANMLTISGEIK